VSPDITEEIQALGFEAGGCRCTFWLFSLFCSKLSAIDISFWAEILGRRRIDEPKNSEDFRCSLLSPAVAWKNHNRREGGITLSC
jgi:hypothetical protein